MLPERPSVPTRRRMKMLGGPNCVAVGGFARRRLCVVSLVGTRLMKMEKQIILILFRYISCEREGDLYGSTRWEGDHRVRVR